MKFIELRAVCTKKGIPIPDFGFLRPDAKLFRSLLLQPAGQIQVSADGLFTTDSKQISKFSIFLELALKSKADLIVTPEYSCPWDTLKITFAQKKFPEIGRLWVIGCQSIKPHELTSIIKKYDEISFIFEDGILDEVSTNGFLDPVCFLFRDKTGKPCIVIQFKQHHMGVMESSIERDNLILGTEAYIVNNSEPTSTSLAVIICSDSMDFKLDDLPISQEASLLLLHPQLNSAPRNLKFAEYRSALFNQGPDNKEVICLNWANSMTMSIQGGAEIEFVNFPHTAIYSKSSELSLEDSKLLQNHTKGLYYFRWPTRYASFYVTTPHEQCIEFLTTKPAQIKSGHATCLRTGPIIQNTYEWDAETLTWKTLESVHDGSDQFLDNLGLRSRNPICNLNKIQLERFVCLSIGKIENQDWHKPDHLITIHANSNEELSRITYGYDATGHGEIGSRLSHAKAMIENFEKRTDMTSETEEDLKEKVLYYCDAYPNANVYHKDSPVGAAIYLGHMAMSDSDKGRVNSIYDALNPRGYSRLYIWYADGTAIKFRDWSLTPDITSAREKHDSIDRGSNNT